MEQRDVAVKVEGPTGAVDGRLQVRDRGCLVFGPEGDPCDLGPVVVRYGLAGGAHNFLSHAGPPDGPHSPEPPR